MLGAVLVLCCTVLCYALLGAWSWVAGSLCHRCNECQSKSVHESALARPPLVGSPQRSATNKKSINNPGRIVASCVTV